MKKIFLAFLSFTLTSCSVLQAYDGFLSEKQGSPPVEETPVSASARIDEAKNSAATESAAFPVFYDVMIETKNIPLSKHEPEEGCLSGCYIANDHNCGGSIEKFELLTGASNALYAEYIRLGDDLPELFIYECMKNNKTPLIIIEPPINGHPYDAKALRKTAGSFAHINTPMFIMFYPITENSSFDADGYVDFFRLAYTVLNKAAGNVSIIWSIPHYDVKNKSSFFPGEQYADWAGVSVKQNVTGNDTVYDDIYDGIDSFYCTYQKMMPIFITLGISHYSSKNSKYYISEASHEITGFYNNIKTRYPRVKGCLYMDENEITPESKRDGDNYVITDDDAIKDAYADSLADNYFIKNFIGQSPSLTTQLIKSMFKAVKLNDKYYISSDTIDFDINKNTARKVRAKTTEINFLNYYDAADIMPIMNYDLFEDTDNLILYLFEK